MKILIDMNLPLKFADFFVGKGIDAVHWIKIGAPTAKDTEIMAYAYENGYIVMTSDLDFNVLLAIIRKLKPSVVQLRTQRISIAQDGEWIVSVLLKNEEHLLNGAIVSMNAKNYRVRLLPI